MASNTTGMVKAGTGAKLKDSNMANYGSKEHTDLIKAVAALEINWSGAGKAKGIEIWRIENKKGSIDGAKAAVFGIKPWPEEKYGQFYSGDSYIVLRTYTLKKDKELHHDIFYWIGKESTTDERGVAAYKAFELDEFLGGEPKQYRLISGNESSRFLKCFKKPIRVMAGGIESGFNKVKPESFVPRLFHIKGRGLRCRCVQVLCDAKSMNEGDVFILDKGLIQIQYNGKAAGGFEKHKGREILTEIRSTRNRGATKVLPPILMDDDDCPEFWAAVNGTAADVKKAADGGCDAEAAKKAAEVTAMYKVSDSSGKIQFSTVKKGKLDMKDLNTNDVFIIDTDEEIFVWVGKKASKTEKREAMMHAERYLAHDESPFEDCTVTRILEGDTDPPLAFDKAFE